MNDRPGFVPANTPPPIPGYESLWPGVNMGTALSGLRAQKVQLTPQQDARLTKARNLRYLKWVLNLVLIGFVLMTIGGWFIPHHHHLDAIIPGVIAVVLFTMTRRVESRIRRLDHF
jgi:hypothetical protein